MTCRSQGERGIWVVGTRLRPQQRVLVDREPANHRAQGRRVLQPVLHSCHPIPTAPAPQHHSSRATAASAAPPRPELCIKQTHATFTQAWRATFATAASRACNAPQESGEKGRQVRCDAAGGVPSAGRDGSKDGFTRDQRCSHFPTRVVSSFVRESGSGGGGPTVSCRWAAPPPACVPCLPSC